MDRNTLWEVLNLDRWLVALRKESVDRNCLSRHLDGVHFVALRKESVDRNCAMQIVIIVADVALRKESVDRNPNSTRRLLMSVGRSPQGERG